MSADTPTDSHPAPASATRLIDGVSPSRQWLPAGDWPTMLDYLAQRFPGISPDIWRERMARGLVSDEHGALIAADTRYRAGACVHYYREVPAEPELPGDVRIIYRDERILVADKPHFLPVAPSGRYVQQTLLTRLRRLGGLDDLVPVHRIDRETAGLVLCSLDPATRDAYTALFRARAIEKTYEAVAPWRADLPLPHVHRSRLVEGEPFFRMREAEGAANSETHVALIGKGEDADGRLLGHYRIGLVTGRKHQIRVHFDALGMPLLNDRFYPRVRNDEPDDFARPLQLLARSLAFTDPVTGEPRRFRSERQLSASAGCRPAPDTAGSMDKAGPRPS